MKIRKLIRATMLTTALLASGSSFATAFTNTSPTGVDVTAAGASTVGGVVADLWGLNGNHVISQLAASSLFIGYYNSGTPVGYQGNPGTIGIQTGFNAGVTGGLGGGLQAASFRFTLSDGDSASGNFDFNDNTLLVNNLLFGNWSGVNAQQTDGVGNAGGSGFSGGGFRNNILDTGWFTSSNAALLSSLFASLVSSESLTFEVQDTDPYDNYYDFTQGLNGSVIDVGHPPVVTPPSGQVPEPATTALLGLGLLGFAASRRKLVKSK